MLSKRSLLKKQIENYVPVTAEDLIDSMTFSQPGDDRVQTSNISDKTCSIALHFRDRVNQLNEEAIGSWVKEYDRLDTEIAFLEHCIRNLPADLYDVMSMLVLDGASWEEVGAMLFISRKAISFRRRKAIEIMTLEYQKRASKIEAVILG